MKKTLIFAILTCMLCLSGNTQEKRISALFTHSTFNNPGSAPYVEVYFTFDAWSLEFAKKADGKYHAELDIAMVVNRVGEFKVENLDSIKQNPQNSNGNLAMEYNETEERPVSYSKKYSLQSPGISDPANNRFSFIDLQRFQLGNGVYVIGISVNDPHSNGPEETIFDTFSVNYPEHTPSLSSILLVSNARPTTNENILSRLNGYDMDPFTGSFIPESVKELNFYFEMYNLQNEVGADNWFATHCYLEVLETGRKVGNIEKFTRHMADTVTLEYNTFDISKLASGNYNLVVEVINKNNDLLLFRKYPFQRSNPKYEETLEDRASMDDNFATKITDDSVLTYYVKALWPIASSSERDFINRCQNSDITERQHFLYLFWFKRNETNAESEWNEYKTRLEYVEETFSYGKRHGFQTDRGRVYMQYGAPTLVIDERNKVSNKNLSSQGQIFYYPYQMWRYDLIPNNEPKRMFVFFDEFMVGDFKLLHSNAFGEPQDMLWERKLSRNMLEEYVQGEAGEQFERGF